jgi:hypothetical protein
MIHFSAAIPSTKVRPCSVENDYISLPLWRLRKIRDDAKKVLTRSLQNDNISLYLWMWWEILDGTTSGSIAARRGKRTLSAPAQPAYELGHHGNVLGSARMLTSRYSVRSITIKVGTASGTDAGRKEVCCDMTFSRAGGVRETSEEMALSSDDQPMSHVKRDSTTTGQRHSTEGPRLFGRRAGKSEDTGAGR